MRTLASPASLTGTGALVKARVRIERTRLLRWAFGVIALVVGSAAGIEGLFPTQETLDAAAAGSDNPAILAFNGPAQALNTLGGQVAFQIGAPGFVITALAGILLTTRLTRAEEESGRLELVRALPVGREAPMAAAAIVVGALHLAIGVGVALGCAALGLPAAGSVAFGIGYTTVGWTYGAIALVTAQVASTARAASGSAGAILAATFVFRAIGDMTNGAASWLSPIGWAQHARPWADERWWVLAVPIVVIPAIVMLARELLVRRDLGSGLIAARPGPATAAARLGSPLGLAVRLHRAALGWWAVGLATFGAIYGVITIAIEDFVEDNPTMADIVTTGLEGSFADSYLGRSTRILALIAAGFSAQAMLRARIEERAGRLEPIVAGAVSRRRWLLSHAVVAAIGSLVVLLASGFAIGTGAAVVTGEARYLAALPGASVSYLPAMLVIVGLGMALTGWLPRFGVATWAVVVAGAVFGMFGELIDFPGWALGLSPFEHVALAPAESFDPAPLAVLVMVALVASAVGLVGMERRDVPQ